MARARNKENKGLPERWRHTHGGFYYQVPQGMGPHWNGKKTFLLGKTLHEAYAVWSARLATGHAVHNVSDLLDRYAQEVIPTKAPSTRVAYQTCLPYLRAVFGEMQIALIRPLHIYQYVDQRRSRKKRGKKDPPRRWPGCALIARLPSSRMPAPRRWNGA